MLSDEEKKAIENLKIEYEKLIKEDNILFPLYKSDAKRLINLIEKQSKEIEELKEENKEIREWKFVIDNPIDLKKLSELDLIKIFGKTYISEHKIKAKIDYLLKNYDSENFINFEMFIKILQSLLEKK